MKNSLTNYDVIILGAGIAGLACADELTTKSKKSVLILEKNAYPGGLAATLKYKNFNYDLSPHRWFTKNEELNIWLNQLIGRDLIWIKKNTPMYQMGKFFHYPIKISDVLFKINPVLGLAMLVSFIFERVRKKLVKVKIRTMKDAYISRFGYVLYKFFNEEFNEKLWGKGGCEKMSADFVGQRVKDLSLVKLIANSLGVGKGKVISLIDRFRYPVLGIGSISKKLEQRIIKNSGQIRYREQVIQIEKTTNHFIVTTDKNQYLSKHLISSIPLPYLMTIINNKLPNKILVAKEKLHFVHQKIVLLFANKKLLTKYTWVYVHPKKISTFRFLETNNWSKKMSPKGMTSLVFEYPYNPGDPWEKIKDQDLIKRTVDDFLKYFSSSKITRKNIVGAKVHRVDFAYPKYDLHYLRPLKKIKTYLKNNYPRLQLIGRSGMFRYNNMDHSIYTGLLAARNLLVGKKIYDLEKVNQEAEYLEEKYSD